MKKTMKKLFALLLTLSMVMSLLAVTVSAAGESGATACGYHQHSDACYAVDTNALECEELLDLVCEIVPHTELCYHVHTEECNGYTCGKIACELENHSHEAADCHLYSETCACQLKCTQDHECVEECHKCTEACGCQLTHCEKDEHDCLVSECHKHTECEIGLICDLEPGDPICTNEKHNNEHVHSEELGCYVEHEHQDACYAKKLICKASKVHVHSSDCYPEDVELGDSAMISKDKYASWSDEANGIADVTLEIGGKKSSSIDVVIILGDEMPAYKEIVESMIELFQPILEDGDPNTNIKLGMISLGRSEFNVLDINSDDAILTVDNYEDVIQAACDANAALPVGPTNLEGALREAYAMLAADEDVAAEDKYVYLLSTGRTYWFNDTDDANGEPATIVNKLYTSGKNYYYWGHYQWQSQRGQHTSLYRVPDRYGNVWENYWADVEKWVKADGDKYVYKMPEGMSYATWSDQNDTEFNGFDPKLASSRYGNVIINPEPTAANFVTGKVDGVGSGTNPQNAMNYERAQYEAAKAYRDLQDAGYNCFALCTEVSYQNYSAWMVKKLGYGGLQVGHGFMDYLAGGPGKAAVVYDDETGAFNEDFFEPIKEHIIHALSAGSKVEDYIGFDSNAAKGYDFDFITAANTITLKVGDVAYTTAMISSETDENGKVIKASYEFTAPGATEATFSLEYVYAEGAAEKFTWNIGETVTITAPATLTYKVGMEKKTEVGLYEVKTNVGAELTPVDSDGNTGEPEAFPIPVLTYEVKDETDPPSDPSNPPSGPSNPPSGPSNPPVIENLPDEDIPLGDLEELPDEDVPLADVPKTGDASVLWLALSALSGTGLFLSRKKREDEE